jgi:fucose permease
MKQLTSIVALTCVFMLACCFVVFGATANDLIAKLGLTDTQWSLVPALFLYTACVVQFFIGAITDKIGHKPVALIGFVITAASMFLIAYAASLTMLYVAAFFLGIGSMSLNTVGNTIIPQVLFGGKDPARASNFGNGFFGLGLMVTPLIIKFTPSMQTGLLILAVLCIVFLVLAVMADYPKAALGFELKTAVSMLGQTPVLIAALALLCYIGLENSMSNWTSRLMNELYTAAGAADPARSSATVLSIFGLAVMVGRFIASGVKNLTAIGIKVLVAASAIAVVTLISLYLAGSPMVAVVAVVLTGLAFAPIFPTVLGVTFAKYEPRYYGSIFGIIFAVGLFGGGLFQNLIGAMAGESVQSGFVVLAVAAALLLVVALVMGRAKKPAAA